ncbi:thiol peroxidase [Candidatus Haliotispira prima]|uniref:Thiol peroxidase n=1 Tax=Candidatus Haliotispira prima TaxID=3034016 RepID=A0ABY8MGI7_9SPIO|nr:thiol peroxidase [Candidatus Haliotispira prima]
MSTKFHGNEVSLKGQFVTVGQTVKDSALVKGDLGDWMLSEQKGKIVLNIYPSIDTPTCAQSTERFNKEAEALSGVRVVCVSKDLPFAQQRFCSAKGIDKIDTLSAFRNSSFGTDYGVEIAAGPLAGLFARAVVIVENGKIIYAQMVSDISEEPNYEAALAALR